MDKHEYREKTERMLEYMSQKSYKEAMDIADVIDWRKVKNTSMICAVSEIYEYNGEYQKARDILFFAFDRAPESKKIIYRLGTLALKLGEVKEAKDCYDEFVALAPKDPNQHILKYKIKRAQKAPLEEQIEILEEFKKIEYVEKWAFELAKLYEEAGMTAECLEECDDMMLWFGEGKYVYQAMELKMKYKPLTPLQQEKYDLRNAKKTAEKSVERLAEESLEEVAEEFAEEVVEEPAEEVVEEPAEEVVEELAETKPAELEATEMEPEEKVENTEENSTMSIEEILQDWEEKQRENAQMIQEKFEEVASAMQDEAAEDVIEEEEDSILPDDIRQLMEELETESADIEAQKVAPKAEPEVEIPIEEAVQDFFESTQFEEAITSSFDETTESDFFEQAPVEEAEGIKLGDTQSIALSAKALKNDTEIVAEEEEKEPIQSVKNGNPYDTGFIVQGKYDLEAQSEIGLKAGLTEEQKKLFSYFVPVRGMSEQIVEVLHEDKRCKSRYGTSRIGNLLIIGRKGSGKTVLAVDIIKAIQKARRLKQGKVGIVTAESLNKKDVTEIMGKLHGGAIIIEKASRLNRRTIEEMCDIMEGQTGEMLVVLEDERKPLQKLLEVYPQFGKKFTSKIELPVFINDELVTFGQTYAKENGYKIDEMGILALYSRIDMLQRDEYAVSVADVKEIMDEAIENASRLSVKKLVQKVLGKNKEEGARVLLREEDFK